MSGRQYKDWMVKLAFPSEVHKLGIVSARSKEGAIERAKEVWEQEMIRYHLKYSAEELEEDE